MVYRFLFFNAAILDSFFSYRFNIEGKQINLRCGEQYFYIQDLFFFSTPQAPTSSPPNSGSFSLSNQALSNPSLTSQALSSHGLTREALDVYARGFPSYRPEDEALRLSLAGAGLPYGIDPAAYAAYAAAAAAYHPAILQQQAALAAHSPYR